jgi:IS6 family transposase
VYRAVDQHGQVIDVFVSKRRDIAAATTFFTTMLQAHGRPENVTTDLAAPLLRVVDELFPEALHDTGQYTNNRIENDHGRLTARLRPMRGLRTDRTASNVIRGHAFVQNLRRGHYEFGVEASHERLRLAAAFDELAEVISANPDTNRAQHAPRSTNATAGRSQVALCVSTAPRRFQSQGRCRRASFVVTPSKDAARGR